ncbi:UNVERIFIED_CONTAM: hypothetical protein NCL1_46678 [Trichonephila clavipes]
MAIFGSPGGPHDPPGKTFGPDPTVIYRDTRFKLDFIALIAFLSEKKHKSVNIRSMVTLSQWRTRDHLIDSIELRVWLAV